MKTQFYTDSAIPCWRCGMTCAEYTVDSAGSLVDTLCYSCGARDTWTRKGGITTAAEASAADRARFDGAPDPRGNWTRYRKPAPTQSVELADYVAQCQCGWTWRTRMGRGKLEEHRAAIAAHLLTCF